MLVNSCITWNISAQVKGNIRDMVNNTEWRVNVAQLMLNWKDPIIEDDSITVPPPVWENHNAIPISNSPTSCVWCVVCGLETSIWKSLQIQIVDTYDRSSNFMAKCCNQHCDIIVNTHVLSDIKWMIFEFFGFLGLTCFEITHNNLYIGLFASSTERVVTIDDQTRNISSSNEINKNITSCMKYDPKYVCLFQIIK